MKIEITYYGQTDTIDLPSDIDLAGISIGTLNVNTEFSEILCGTPVMCEIEQKILDDGTVVTVYLYRLSGAAKALSLKDYKGLICCDILYGSNLSIKLIV